MTLLRAAARAIALAAVVCIAFAPPTTAAEPSLVTLKNGMRVALAPDSLATAVDVAVWYAAGPRWEPAGQQGITRLLERTMYRGTTKYGDGEFVRRIVREGGTLNTSSTADYSCLWETVPAEALGLTLRLEADRMAGLHTSPQAFEAERRAAREDLSRAALAPIARGLTRLFATLFPGQPYGRPVGGTDADLARLTPIEMEAWRHARYTPGNALLTVTGRFDPAATIAAIRADFEALPRGEAPPVAPPFHAAPLTRQRATETLAVPTRVVLAGWRTPGAGDAGGAALALLAQVVSANDSPLADALANQWKVAVAAQGGLDEHREASVFWALAVVRSDADSSTAERVLVDEIKRLGREPLAGDVLDRARLRLLTTERFADQSVRARAQALGEGVLLAGDLAAHRRRLAAIEALTPADVQQVAQRCFIDDARAVVWLVPGASEGGAR